MPKKRCTIYPKDIQMITGRSERYGQVLLHKIREFYGKKPYQFITVQEFSEFSGLDPEEVSGYLY